MLVWLFHLVRGLYVIVIVVNWSNEFLLLFFFFFYVCVLPWEAFSLPWNLQVGSKFVGKFVKKISSKTSKVFISFSLSFTMLNIAEVQMYIFHFKLFIQHLMVLTGRSIIHKKKQNLLTPMIKVVSNCVRCSCESFPKVR